MLRANDSAFARCEIDPSEVGSPFSTSFRVFRKPYNKIHQISDQQVSFSYKETCPIVASIMHPNYIWRVINEISFWWE